MSEKYTPADGDPVDMSQVTLGPRYSSEDMYRDMGINPGTLVSVEKDGVIYTDTVQSVNYSGGSPAIYRELNRRQWFLRRLTPARWRRPLLVRDAESPAVTVNVGEPPVGKTLAQLEAMKAGLERLDSENE
jgi:hypothetical protein